jgi:hypothetical protein
MRCEEGWGKGMAFPFIKIYERERHTLTPTFPATYAEKPLLTKPEVGDRYRLRMATMASLWS